MEQRSTQNSTRHGELPSPELPPPGHPDPHLFNVYANMSTYLAMESELCSCEDLCTCRWDDD